MLNQKVVKVIGLLTTVVGFGVSILSDWVDEKKMDNKINEKVTEALEKQEKEKES